MPSEERQNISVLWYSAAVFIGGALPLMSVGRAVTSTWLVLGLILGACAMGREFFSRTGWKEHVASPLGFTTAALLGTFALSAIFSINPGHSWNQWGQLLLVAVLSTVLMRVLMAMPTRAVRMTLNTLASLTVVLATYILIYAFTHLDRGFITPEGLGVDPKARFNYFSSVLAILGPFVWVWLLRLWRDGKMSRTVAYLVAALVLIAMIVANGRAGLFGTMASMLVFVGLAWRFHGLHITWRSFAWFGLFLALGFAAYTFTLGYDYTLYRMDLTRFDETAYGRLPIWQIAFSHMLDNPFTGIGVQNFRYLASLLPSDVAQHPHNFIIQLLLEVGLLGTIAAGAFIYRLFRNLWKYGEVTLYSAAGLASLTAFFTCALMNTSIYQARWLVFMVVAYALAVRLCRAPKVGE